MGRCYIKAFPHFWVSCPASLLNENESASIFIVLSYHDVGKKRILYILKENDGPMMKISMQRLNVHLW